MLLAYRDRRREDAFTLYVTPKPRSLTIIVICLVPAGIYEIYAFLGDRSDFGTSEGSALLIYGAWLVVFALFGAILFVTHHLSARSSVKKRAMLCWLHDCNWAVLCAVAYVPYRPQATPAVRDNCDNDRFLYEQTTSMAFRDYNCWRRLHINIGIGILVLCVVLQVRFRECAIAAAIGSLICTPLALATWPHRHVELTIADFIYTLALTAFIAFARYEMEKDQRRAFEVHEALGRHLEELEMLSAEIEYLIKRLLPRGIISRTSSAQLHGKLMQRDTSHEAIALVMKVADFESEAMHRLQERVALVIESAMDALSSHLPDCGLERVSVLLDEFVAVGNLLEPIDTRTSVISTCSAAQKLAAVRTEGSLPLVFGIDIGMAVGEFVGNVDFMRYNVRGPVVDVARALTRVAKPRQVLLSNTVTNFVSDVVLVDHCSPHIEMSNLNLDNPTEHMCVYQSARGPVGCSVVRHINPLPVHEVSKEPNKLHTTVTFSDPDAAFSSADREDNALLVVEAARLHYAVQRFEPLESELVRDCCLYRRFHDPEVEQDYVKWRMHANVNRGQRTWLVYAWVVLAFAVVLLLDMDEVRGPHGLILFMVASFASFAASQLPSRLQHRDIGSWFHWWGALTLLIPLVVITGMGISRPSAIGNDVRATLIAGTIARVTSFAHARHELLATPFLLLLSHLQHLAPGGAIRAADIPLYVVLILYVSANASVDHAQRLAFAASRRLKEATNYTICEQDVRVGLLRSSMPLPVFRAFQKTDAPGIALTVPDTHVIAVSRVAPIHQSLSEIPRAEDFDMALCDTLRGLSNFHIISITGDRALVMAGVCTSFDDISVFTYKVNESGDQEVLIELLTFCARMTANGPYRCISDIDTTVQAINPANSTVTFTAYGVAVTRTLAIDAAAGEALGVLVSSRVMSFVSGAPTLPVDMSTKPLPTWRIRGVGQFQLTELSIIL